MERLVPKTLFRRSFRTSALGLPAVARTTGSHGLWARRLVGHIRAPRTRPSPATSDCRRGQTCPRSGPPDSCLRLGQLVRRRTRKRSRGGSAMDRASVFETEGCGFEPRPPRQPSPAGLRLARPVFFPNRKENCPPKPRRRRAIKIRWASAVAVGAQSCCALCGRARQDRALPGSICACTRPARADKGADPVFPSECCWPATH